MNSIECREMRGQICCPICLYTAGREGYRLLYAESYFGGGRLERYECPVCGVIFGPASVLYLSEDELAKEYQLLYQHFHEADLTEHEIQIFKLLRPRPDGVYLNFGSGAWSKTISKLRSEGWQVYGFDPYAGNELPNVFSSIEQVEQMTFDGIFSNNLIEHLTNPVATFRMLKTLLAAGGSMAHSTPCYRYCYEKSKFHLFFYTGKSVDVICQAAELRETQRVEFADSTCVIFAPIERTN